MSERGQKIFKWVVWLVIIALFVLKVISLATMVNDAGTLMSDGSVTREVWMEQLSDGFGDPNIATKVQNGDEPATGEYAAITAMDAIGEERLAYLTEGDINSQTKIDLALQYVEGAKPTTKAEYLTMCSELGEELSLTITVAVTAVFVGA